MLLADALASDSLIGSLIQAGSFGLLTIVVIYVGRVLIPKIFVEHERMLNEHREERQKADTKNDEAHARRDTALKEMSASITAELKNVSSGLIELNGRVERLETHNGNGHDRQTERGA